MSTVSIWDDLPDRTGAFMNACLRGYTIMYYRRESAPHNFAPVITDTARHVATCRCLG